MVSFRSIGIVAIFLLCNGHSKTSSGIVFKCELNENLSSEYYGYFDITIENSSEDRLVLKSLSIAFHDEVQNKNMRIVSGTEYSEWAGVMGDLVKSREKDNAAAAALLATIGSGIAAFSGNQSLSHIGGIGATVGAAALVSSAYSRGADSQSDTASIYKKWLMADSIVVLPGLFTRRWLLINTKNHQNMDYIKKISFRFTVNSKIEAELVEFRDTPSNIRTNWQQSIFDRKGYLRPKAERR